jgi:hypothetical protein
LRGPAFAPEDDKVRRQRRADQQRADQDVRVDDQPHALSSFGRVHLTSGSDGVADDHYHSLSHHMRQFLTLARI